METMIKKWGNSLAVRLPRNIAQKLALKAGSVVEMSETKKMIVIQPAPKPRKSLKDLVAMIRPENLHKEIEWGKPHGKEVW